MPVKSGIKNLLTNNLTIDDTKDGSKASIILDILKKNHKVYYIDDSKDQHEKIIEQLGERQNYTFYSNNNFKKDGEGLQDNDMEKILKHFNLGKKQSEEEKSAKNKYLKYKNKYLKLKRRLLF